MTRKERRAYRVPASEANRAELGGKYYKQERKNGAEKSGPAEAGETRL